MEIGREEAVLLAAFLQLLSLSEQKRSSLIESARLEQGLSDETLISEAAQHLLLRKYLAHELSHYTHSYIAHYILQKMGATVTISGDEMQLVACPCCHYRTLNRSGEYDICAVCFWEDDGVTQDDSYSGPNHMTLGEGKINYAKYEAVTENLGNILDADRKMRYVYEGVS